MIRHLYEKLRGTCPRPVAGDRPRPGRRALRPRLEGLESRQLLTVSFAIEDGELQVFSGNGETVTLEHSGTNTVVNGASFADSAISTGVSIHVGSFFGGGLNTVNIRSTLKPVKVDSPGRIDFLNIGGAANGAQGILASVNVEGFALGANVAVDDSGNISSRNVQLDNVNGVNIVTGLAP